MKKVKAKKKIIETKAFKSAISTIAVIALCLAYYFLSPYFLFEKPSSADDFPMIISSEASGDMEVHFLDVGQGDAVYIKTPDDKNVLIDCGIDDKSVTDKVVNYLKSRKVKVIDYAVATHPDADHIGGFIEIFDNFKVKFVFRPYVKSDNKSTDRLKNRFNPPYANYCETDIYADFVNALNKERSSWVFTNKDTDVKINYSDGSVLKFDFLTPTKEISEIYYYDLNDYSPLLRISYNDFSFMFTGDATFNVEKEALDEISSLILNSDVIKIAHHGADTSSSYDFLKAVHPKYAVVSCGALNAYGHPKQSVLTTLLTFGTDLYRTDLQGDIVFKVDKNGLVSIETEKNYEGSIYKGY